MWVVLAFVLPLALAQRPGDTLSRPPGPILLAIVVLSSTMFCRLVIEAQPRYMAFCFWIFVYIWFGLTAFLQVDQGVFSRRETYVGSTYSDQTLATAAGIILVGCLAYLVGGAVAATRHTASARPARRARVLSLPRLQIAATVAVVLSVAAIASIGLGNLFSSREAVASTAPGWTKAARIVIFVAAFLVVYAFRGGRVFPWRALSLASRTVMVGAVIGALVVANPIGTQRAIVAMVYGAIALAAIPRSSRRGIRLVFVALLLGTVIVFPALDAFRRETPLQRELLVVGASYDSLAAVLRDPNGNYSMFTQVADGVDYVDRFGTTNGAHLTADAFVFVPRSVWTGKARDVGDSVADALGYPPRLNFSSPLWMELYVDGGWLLVMVGMVGYGWASRWLDRASEARPENTFLPALVTAVAFYQFYLLRGSLLAAMPLFYVLVVTMFLVFAPVARARGLRRPASAEPS